MRYTYYHMNNTLESSKYFPYIAWALVIGFALFAYMLTVRVQEELTSIAVSVERLETKIDTMGTQTIPRGEVPLPDTNIEVQ